MDNNIINEKREIESGRKTDWWKGVTVKEFTETLDVEAKRRAYYEPQEKGK